MEQINNNFEAILDESDEDHALSDDNNYISDQRRQRHCARTRAKRDKKHFNIKVNTVFNGEFVTGDKRANKSINMKNCELFRTSDLHDWYERRVIELTLASLEEFQERDSGWALSRILDLTINVNKYNPMRAGCHVKLPQEIMKKKAVINVQSIDNACFAWSVVAALYPVERNAERESSYPHYTTVLNLQDIEFPVTVNQIKKFERANDISINVYCLEEKNIVPIRLSELKRDKQLVLHTRSTG
ncbi:hypothetical protein ACFW04_011091 [Cataglyphis niger]